MVNNKAILVTGAAKRIGKAIALNLAKSGYDIALNYNNSAEDALALSKQIESLGVKCQLLQANLNKREQCVKLIEDAHRAFPSRL